MSANLDLHSPLRVLAILLEPDDRPGTEQWQVLLAHAATRPDVDVHVWFLRDRRDERWAGAWNVDALRTWWPNQVLSRIGLGVLASWLRGRELRRRFSDLAPDVIILDAGWGQRLLRSSGGGSVVAVRENPWAPLSDPSEERRPETGEWALGERSGDAAADGAPGTRPKVHWSPYLTAVHEHRGDLAAARDEQRAALGLAPGSTVVVGWGEDGWVDGSDLFVRTLWYLSDRHGIHAEGVWIGPLDDASEVERLQSEARRCGLGDRLHLVASSGSIDLRCGDVVHLPRRVPLDWRIPSACAACDLTVVTSGEAPFAARWIRPVPPLDLPAAASELARALQGPRPAWSAEVDPHRVLDGLRAAVPSVQP